MARLNGSKAWYPFSYAHSPRSGQWKTVKFMSKTPTNLLEGWIAWPTIGWPFGLRLSNIDKPRLDELVFVLESRVQGTSDAGEPFKKQL